MGKKYFSAEKYGWQFTSYSGNLCLHLLANGVMEKYRVHEKQTVCIFMYATLVQMLQA